MLSGEWVELSQQKKTDFSFTRVSWSALSDDIWVVQSGAPDYCNTRNIKLCSHADRITAAPGVHFGTLSLAVKSHTKRKPLRFGLPSFSNSFSVFFFLTDTAARKNCREP